MEKLGSFNITDWQELYNVAKNDYDDVLNNIEDNEQAYLGTRKIKTPTGQDAQKQTGNVRKMCYELVESQVDTQIPMPKVTSLLGYEDRAIMIESMLRNELDRQDTEEFIDEQGRITPIAGGSIFYLEWDNDVRTHYNIGALKVKNLHPSQFIPQPGVYKVEDMDYIFLNFEQSKRYVEDVYGVNVDLEGDAAGIDSRTTDQPYDHMCTHIFCYYKNGNGGIGLFSWVGDVVVQDYKDYFSRKHDVCSKCGKTKGECECKKPDFKTVNKEFQEFEIEKDVIDPMTGMKTTTTERVKIPYYVFNEYPVVVHKNIAMINNVLGLSDVDMIKDQQNDLSIFMAKIREKLLKGGSVVSKAKKTRFEADDEEFKVVEFSDPAEAQMFDVKSLQPNVNNDINLLEMNYTIGRQTLGITDSFQGRSDRTATSGKAKNIAVSQTKGRLESKKIMKDFAFSKLFEKMFKMILAFTDEQIPYVEEKTDGRKEYKWFDKRFFVEQDKNGDFYYVDMYVFGVDVAGTLANDRQAMWQETRSNFESGAYGDPTQLDTLVMYWTTMNKLHYPCAPDALKLLEARQQEQAQMAQQQLETEATANAMANAKLPELLDENAKLNSKVKDMKDDQVRSKRLQDEEKVNNALSDIGL